ncbi:MAG: glycosyltransferase family 4 protein [Thermodesulfobacteriota bacterium]
MKVHWVCPLPTHYHAHLFRAATAELGIPLLVHFLRSSRSTHPWRAPSADGFAARVVSSRMGLDPVLHDAVDNEPGSVFVVAGWQGAVVVPLLVHLMLRRRAFCIWTDTPKLARRRLRAKEVARAAWLRVVLSRAAAVLGTGRPAVIALEQLGSPRERIHDFPFTVDLESFRPGAFGSGGASRGELVLLSSGRLVNRLKGFDLALAALARLKQQGFGEFRYRIAGSGPDRPALEAQAEGLGIERAVEFLGWVEARDLPDFYRSGDLLLHPARIDPFPNVVLEAMACGIPVVGSSAAGSVRDRVEHGRNGFVHETDDIDELARILIGIAREPTILAELGRRARLRALEWPAARNVAVLREIVERCEASRGRENRPMTRRSERRR